MESSVAIGIETNDSGFSSWQCKGISLFSKALEAIVLSIQRVRVPFHRTKRGLTTDFQVQPRFRRSGVPPLLPLPL